MDEEADFVPTGSGQRPFVRLVTQWCDMLAAEGRRLAFFLRDDDAVEPSPALDRLLDLTRRDQVPLLLAIIPKRAGPALADRLASEPHVSPCQHGFSHRNHQPPGSKPAELGNARPAETVLAELAEGRRKLQDLFGARLSDVLVPPWNRIDDRLLPHLPALGYGALSRFGRVAPDQQAALPEINATLDIIDWKQGKRGRALGELAARIEADVETATDHTVVIGILTHHLDHDERAWRFLEQITEAIAAEPRTGWVSADALLADGAGEVR